MWLCFQLVIVFGILSLVSQLIYMPIIDYFDLDKKDSLLLSFAPFIISIIIMEICWIIFLARGLISIINFLINLI